MLNQLFTDPIALRSAQAVSAAAFAMLVAFLARRQGIYLQREAVIALVRGITQIIIVGLLLTFVLGGRSVAQCGLCSWA